MDRRATATTTLAVLGVLTLLMLVVGFGWATKPFPTDTLGSSEPPLCEPRVIAPGTKVRPADVTVSVYNASGRTGLASSAMADLMERGFGRGTSGNVKDADVDKVEVWAKSEDNPAARLVASQFGSRVPIRTDHPDVGVGIVVVLGKEYRRLANNAPTMAGTREDVEICSPYLG